MEGYSGSCKLAVYHRWVFDADPRDKLHPARAKGLEVLASKPEKIDAKFLRRFPEFQEFVKPAASEPSGFVPLQDG